MKEKVSVFLPSIIGIIFILFIVVLDKFKVFDDLNDTIYVFGLFLIIVCILLFITNKAIRIIKIKKVDKNDLKKLDEFTKYKIDNTILKENNYLKDFNGYLIQVIRCFKRMEKTLDISSDSVKISKQELKQIKNKKIKEYILKVEEVYKIIFKYYDDRGIRKI